MKRESQETCYVDTIPTAPRMAEQPPSAAQTQPVSAVVFLREEGSHADFVPIRHNAPVTLHDLADEYGISSVLECDATGRVQPRAVTFDSPSDVLRGGTYYIARRDVRRVGVSPRVAFRGKITVEEFDTGRAVREAENAAPTDPKGPIGAERQTTTHPERKRSAQEAECSEGDTEFGGGMYTFVPFMGDLYDDGRSALIQLKDVLRLCDNVESDEAEYAARHSHALAIIKKAGRGIIGQGDKTCDVRE